MTREEAESLRPGDRVWWDDPDNGACSREYVVESARVLPDDEVVLTSSDGSTLHAPLGELMRVGP